MIVIRRIEHILSMILIAMEEHFLIGKWLWFFAIQNTTLAQRNRNPSNANYNGLNVKSLLEKDHKRLYGWIYSHRRDLKVASMHHTFNVQYNVIDLRIGYNSFQATTAIMHNRCENKTKREKEALGRSIYLAYVCIYLYI